MTTATLTVLKLLRAIKNQLNFLKMKNLLNVKGAKALTKNEQQTILGGHHDRESCIAAGGIWSCNAEETLCHCEIDGLGLALNHR